MDQRQKRPFVTPHERHHVSWRSLNAKKRKLKERQTLKELDAILAEKQKVDSSGGTIKEKIAEANQSISASNTAYSIEPTTASAICDSLDKDEKIVDKQSGKKKKKVTTANSLEPKIPSNFVSKQNDPLNSTCSNDVVAIDAKAETEIGVCKTDQRHFTLSIALPGSIMDNAQSLELATYLVGQIARAAVVYRVDEIIVFDENAQLTSLECQKANNFAHFVGPGSTNCNFKMLKILQYLECPQYLRRSLFPLQKALQFAGVLNPLDCPHHMRFDDYSITFREAVVLSKNSNPAADSTGRFVNAGLEQDVWIPKCPVSPGQRITVYFKDIKAQIAEKRGLSAKLTKSTAPRRKAGLYWGYRTRLAASLGAVFSDCPFSDGYDLTIGTSERGQSLDTVAPTIRDFKHALIVFGGLHGLESCLENDQSLNVDDPATLFKHYLNTCPNQGSRTIRTEEAILISLAALSSSLKLNN